MRRFTFWIFAGFFTFAIGCFIVFGYFWKYNLEKTNTEDKVIVQVSTSKNNASTSFYYDFFKAQYENRFPKPVERQVPFCKDERILPLWNLIKKDNYFREMGGETFIEPDCSKMFKILDFDLNKDGKKEMILRGNSSDLCGGTGNCGFWIFEKKGKEYRKILSSSDNVDVSDLGEQIQKNKTNGYRNILLKGHFSASETTYQHYSFIGGKYKLVKDLIETCSPCSGENPKWEMMTWKEYEKLNP